MAYADDLAIISRNWRKLGRTLPSFFEKVKRASSLGLNCSKCVFVPLIRGGIDELKNQWDIIAPTWSSFAVSGYGKYLGFYVGPDADNREWIRIWKEIDEVAAAIKSLRLSKFQSLLLFQILGLSKLGFVAQLRDAKGPFKDLDTSFRKKIVGGPEGWCPTNFLPNLKEACGFPISLKDVQTLCKATMTRCAHLSVNLDRANSIMNAAQYSPGNLIAHPFPKWIESCSIKALMRAKENLPFHVLQDVTPKSDIIKSKLVQSHAYGILLKSARPFDLFSTICYRFELREWFDTNDIPFYANLAVNFIKKVSKLVPPCVMFSVFLTYFNGWATSARFQKIDRVCLLCFDCEGSDSLEHYSCCPYQWIVFSRKFRKSVYPQSIARFLGLNVSSDNDMIYHACHMYAVYSAYNSRKHSGTITGPESVEKLIWQGHRTAALFSDRVRKLYNSIWVIND